MRALVLALLASLAIAADLPSPTSGDDPVAVGSPQWPGPGPAGPMRRIAVEDTGLRYLDLVPGPLTTLPRNRAVHLLIMLHAANARQAREARLVVSDAKGRPREVARLRIPAGGWQAIRSEVTLPDGDLSDLTLVCAGPLPVASLGSAWGETPPPLHVLGLRCNALITPLYEGSRGLTQIGRTLWAVFPRATAEVRLLTPTTGDAAERLRSAIAEGWNRLPPDRPRSENRRSTDADDPFSYKPTEDLCTSEQVRTYQDLPDLGEALAAAIADRPRLIAVHLPTTQGPLLKVEGLSRLHQAATRAGSVLAIILDERTDNTRLAKDWLTWIAQVQATEPALPLLDLTIAGDWSRTPGVLALDAQAILLGQSPDLISEALTEGFADLRARLEWVLFDARDEVDITVDRRRTTTNPP